MLEKGGGEEEEATGSIFLALPAAAEEPELVAMKKRSIFLSLRCLARYWGEGEPCT